MSNSAAPKTACADESLPCSYTCDGIKDAFLNEVARGGLQNRLAERNEGSGNEIAPFQTGAVPDLHAGELLPFWFTFQFACRESKLSTFGVYCAFVFKNKVSLEGYSFPVTY